LFNLEVLKAIKAWRFKPYVPVREQHTFSVWMFKYKLE
jgi:outer membrane biosynthesis protein TonB